MSVFHNVLKGIEINGLEGLTLIYKLKTCRNTDVTCNSS